ncbi:tail fiber protein [uncultured Chitinophaga sp.]|jgi:Microcystin-dependent protein|uniref:phage tail protein n=1 Tax=uncultured Chitinophaga sp. TaxID=339340 RepID=UPI00345590B2
MTLNTPLLSEICMVSFNFPPKGYAMCNGQQLPVDQHQALFSWLRAAFYVNGQTNFALPNFRGRIPVHQDNPR